MSHFSRKEIAERTGYSERTISRIAGEIPGATPTRTGRWAYPERSNSDAEAWIQRARIANDSKRKNQEVKIIRKSKKSATSLVADVQAVQACAAAFNRCRPFLLKIHLHGTGIDFDEALNYDEWVLFVTLIKSFTALPPPDRMELLMHYFQGSELPIGFKDFFEFTQWLGSAMPPMCN